MNPHRLVEVRTDIISSYQWGNGGRGAGKQCVQGHTLLRVGR